MTEQSLPSRRLDTRVAPVLRVIGASLDEDPTSSAKVVMHGRLDPATLRFLKVDYGYQRPLGNRPEIWGALKSGVVLPSVELGVRGQNFSRVDDDYLIHDPVYIIDGWQRIGTAIELLDQMPELPVRIFASIHFGTTAEWERGRFTDLNRNVKKISPNLHLRNMRDGNEAVLTLFGLSGADRTFALFEKVQWSQSAVRGQVISALTLAKVAQTLHSHATVMHGVTAADLAYANARAATNVGLPTYRRNVHTFFKVLDEFWGLRQAALRPTPSYTKQTFLICLAKVFSDHVDFWDAQGKVFFVPSELRSKIKAFPVRDPQVANLSGSGGAARHMLYQIMINHINSGKRTRHLQRRGGLPNE